MTASLSHKSAKVALVLFVALAGCGDDRPSVKKIEPMSSSVSGSQAKTTKAPATVPVPTKTKEKKPTTDFEIAMDADSSYTDRVAAASKLKADQLNEVRKQVLARLVDRTSKNGYKDSNLLAHIGDLDTAKGIALLEEQETQAGIFIAGKLSSARMGAIKHIRERETEKRIHEKEAKSIQK